ncbi:MAG: flagellar hook-basal body complex protein [Alphaproteobacteria bacterium]|nr:MAG: flagellar hook-basal body complex protein [Alphaproteobacteria bacterium]
MTISSSLNAGVSGLFANASKLSTISDNIANSETHGYKRATTEFASLVTSDSATMYTAGGVTMDSFRLVDGKGGLTGTSNATDIAVGGKGMLPVTTLAAVTSGTSTLPFMMTATGSFRRNEDGYLTTPSGLVLLGWQANPDGSIPSNPRDSASALVPVQITPGLTATPTTAISLGVNLPAADSQAAVQAGTPGTAITQSVEYIDNLGGSQTLSIAYTPTGAAANEWDIDISDSGGVISSITVTFDDTQGNGGELLSVAGTNVADYNSTTGILTVTLTSGDTIDIDIGAPGDSDNLTQLDADFAPLNVTKDGTPAGTLVDTTIDQNGNLTAVYDTGFTRTIYKIPLATVPNFNGLTAEDNQAFSISADSGALYLWDPGTGPAGETIGYALEESTTDVAAELTQLIKTQRAYSSNAKIIQTVDEMLQETTNLKR